MSSLVVRLGTDVHSDIKRLVSRLPGSDTKRFSHESHELSR